MTEITSDALLAEHAALEDTLEAAAKQFATLCKPHRDRLEAIKSEMQTRLLAMNSDKPEGKRASISTDHGTAYLSTIVQPKVTDKEKFLDFVLDDWNARGAMLQIGQPQKDAFDDYCNNHQGALPPHTEVSKLIRCNIRRS